MKPNIREHTDIVVGATDEIAVTIQANAVSFLASVSGLARDKTGYPIRELASNAWDAAGGDFTVQLPTKVDPVFKVRDFGPGMDATAMRERYPVLYASDKRGDDTKVGSWGAGRFSPFAYLITAEGAAPYTVTSWTERRARTYLVSLNAGGTPVIRLLADMESDEPTGMEVAFAVREADVQTFHDRAREILWGFEPRPVITPSIDWPEPQARLSGEGWTLYARGSVPFEGPHVRMGCAVYPIDPRQLSDRALLSGVEPMLFEAPIGSLSPTLSREALAYDDRTKGTLDGLAQSYRDAFIESVQARVSEASSWFEACRLFTDLTDVHHTLRRPAREAVRWRELMLYDYINVPSAMLLRPGVLGNGWANRQTERFDADGSINPAHCADATVVIEHNPGHSITKLKTAGLEGRKVLWIRCKRADREALLARLGNPGGVITLDEIKVAGTPGRPATVRRRRTLQIEHCGAHSTHVSQVTQDVDLSRPLVVVSAYGNADYDVAGVGPDLAVNARLFRGSLQVMRDLGLLPDGMIVLVKTPSEHVQEHWSWFSTWACAALRPLAERFQPTGFEDLSTSSFGGRLSWLSALPDHLVQALPGDLQEVAREAVSLRARIARSGEPEQMQAYRAHKELCRYDAPARQRTQSLNPIQPVEGRINAACERHPLFGLIADHGAERAWRASADGHGFLAEYARLLRMSGQVDGQEHRDLNQREAA